MIPRNFNYKDYSVEYPLLEPEECKDNILYVYVVDNVIKIKYAINISGQRQERVIIPQNPINMNDKNSIISMVKKEEMVETEEEIRTRIVDYESGLTHINSELKTAKVAVSKCEFLDLKRSGETVCDALDKIQLNKVEPDDIYILNQALIYITRIANSEVIDLTDEKNPIAELEKIRKELNKQSRFKQVAAALFLFLGTALIIGTVVACVLFPPVGLAGIALGMAVAKILVATLAGAASTYLSVKTLHKEWKHKKSTLKLVGDELGKFALKAKETSIVKIPFKPSFYIEYCGNSEIPKRDARCDIAEFKSKIIYTPQVIQAILESKATKNDESRDASREQLSTLLPNDLPPDEKKSASDAILAARAGITNSSQAGGLNAGPMLLNYYFVPLLSVPINPLSKITKIEKIDNGFSIETAYIPDTYRLPPPSGSMDAPEIKNPFQYTEKYHLIKVGDNWELTIKDNNLSINPKLWKIMLENATVKLNTNKQFTNNDLFAFVPCLADAKFSDAFIQKLKAQPTIIRPEDQYSLLSKLISANYGDKWPVHLDKLKSVIEKNTPTPQPTQRLRM